MDLRLLGDGFFGAIFVVFVVADDAKGYPDNVSNNDEQARTIQVARTMSTRTTRLCT